MVEHLPDMQAVGGSSPPGRTTQEAGLRQPDTKGKLAGENPALRSSGISSRCGEHLFNMQEVEGSIPSSRTRLYGVVVSTRSFQGFGPGSNPGTASRLHGATATRVVLSHEISVRFRVELPKDRSSSGRAGAL